MSTLIDKYGNWALIAGASEGIGAAFSRYLAQAGFNLILVARRLDPLEQLATELRQAQAIEVRVISCDLSRQEAARELRSQLEDIAVGILVYNAAMPYIGRFEEQTEEHQYKLSITNMVTPMNMIREFGFPMLEKGKGAVIMMGSLAGFQGSGFLTAYASSKAFDRVLAESLWYEWKDRGVDVIACCAGATSTPNYINTQPEKSSFFAPRVQTPEEVAKETFRHLGKRPSFITGRGNKWASFLMQRLMPRRLAVRIMGDNTRKMYRI